MRLFLLSLPSIFLLACTMDPTWPTDRYRPCTQDADCLNECRCLDGLCVPPEGAMPPSICGCMQNTDCEDGDPCTTQSCNTATGECESEEIEDCCRSQEDCDDANSCTADSCVNNACQNLYICGDCNQSGCENGLHCDGASGQCVACLDNSHCDDQDPCSLNFCMPDHACDFTQVDLGAACDDGIDCTTGDACTADGTCIGTPSAWSEVCFSGQDEDCDGVADQCCLGHGAFATLNQMPGDNDLQLGLVAADFDGDHILDLFSAEDGQAGNNLLLGQGNLGFGNGTFLRQEAGGCSPVDFFVSADFDGDLLPDIALLCQSTDGTDESMLQLLGTLPPGRLTAQDPLMLPSYPKGMAGGDFDRDGRMDLLITFSEQAPMAFRHHGVGTEENPFRTYEVCLDNSYEPFLCQGPVTAGDFDGDGWTDVACFHEDGIHLLINRGWGCEDIPGIEFTHLHVLEQTLLHLIRPIILDLNRDGRPDLAALGTTPELAGLMIFIQTGPSGEPAFDSLPAIVMTVDEHSHIATGDFNNDALMDLAVSSGSTGETVTLLLADGSNGGYEVRTLETSGILTGLAAGDFDADGIFDLALQSRQEAIGSIVNVSVLKGLGPGGRASGTFSVLDPYEPLAWETAQPVHCVLSLDLNNDGMDDLAVGGVEGLQVFFAQGNDARPSGGFDASIQLSLGSPIEWITSGDLNGDGHLDLVAGSSASAEMLYFQGIDGGNFEARTLSFNHSFTAFSADGLMLDVDRDGRDELFVVHRPHLQEGMTGYSIGIGVNRLSFSFAPYRNTFDSTTQDLIATDFNQDGWEDLVLLIEEGDLHKVEIWSNQGIDAINIQDRFQTISSRHVLDTATLLDCGDLNGDGWPDVAVAGGGTLQVLRNEEGRDLAMPSDDPRYFNIESLLLRDLDRDGLYDVVLSDPANGMAQIKVVKTSEGAENQWVFFSEPMAYELDFAQSGGLCAGRFNHDGFLDLAVGDGSGDMGIQLLLGQGDCH